MADFHHIGLATADLRALASAYERVVGVALTTAVTADSAAGVNVAFAALGDGSFIEFVEPRGPGSPIDRIVERGGGPYHLCFRVHDLDGALSAARDAGAIVVSPPRPAPALGGKRVAFIYVTGNNLIEYLEE